MPGKIKLIVTADDYGILNDIDKAIREGISLGIINTVTVVVSKKPVGSKNDYFKNSLRKLIQLLIAEKKLDKVGIGLHLNLTMGKPVLDDKLVKSLVNSKKNFYTWGTYQAHPDFKRFDLGEIELEANAQMKLFKDYLEEIAIDEKIAEIPIDHVTSHFNQFHSVPKLAKILVRICTSNKSRGKKKSLPLPIRRPIPAFVEYKNNSTPLGIKQVEAAKNTFSYILRRNLNPNAPIYRARFLTKSKLRGLINNTFIPAKIRCAHSMFFSFYATKKDFTKKIGQFNDLLWYLHELAARDGIVKRNGTMYLEVVHHLGKTPSKSGLKKMKDISGFDRKLFKKFRPNEFAIINNPAYADIFNHPRIEHGLFSDIPGV